MDYGISRIFDRGYSPWAEHLTAQKTYEVWFTASFETS
jgi:hypothetical protein